MRRYRVIISFFTAVAVSLSTGPVASETADRIARWKAETVKHPDSIRAWVNLSKAYVELAREDDDFHQYARAESSIMRAWGIDTTDAGTLTQLAVVQAGYKNYLEAVRYSSKALAENLYNAEAWGLRGEAFLATGRYRGADSCFYVMRQLDEGFDTLVRLSRRSVDIGTYEEAVDLMIRAVQVAEEGAYSDKVLAAAYCELATLFLLGGRWDEADALLEKALGLSPTYVPALSREAELLGYRGEVTRAIEVYRAILRESPNPRYMAALAKLLARSGNRSTADSLLGRAQAEYESLAAKYPDAFAAELAAFYLDTDTNLDQALKLAWKASRKRRDVHTYELLARAYYKNGKYDTAWSSISLALRKRTKHPRILYYAALMARAVNKLDRYEYFAGEARRLNPKLEVMFGPL